MAQPQAVQRRHRAAPAARRAGHEDFVPTLTTKTITLNVEAPTQRLLFAKTLTGKARTLGAEASDTTVVTDTVKKNKIQMSSPLERIPLTPGCTVRGFVYQMQDRTSWTWSSARTYLAQSPAGFPDERLIQFWHEDHVPGEYHGEWTCNGPDLVLSFNGRGPGNADRKNLLHVHCLHRTTWEPLTYEGIDHCKRKIRMVFRGRWVLKDNDTFERLPDLAAPATATESGPLPPPPSAVPLASGGLPDPAASGGLPDPATRRWFPNIYVVEPSDARSEVLGSQMCKRPRGEG